MLLVNCNEISVQNSLLEQDAYSLFRGMLWSMEA